MKIIVGLGNPGEKYQVTRHNVGFMAVSALQKKWNFPDFEFNKRFKAHISKGQFQNQEVLLLKPETFMNLSGLSVQAALDFYKLTSEDLLVIHDDLDIMLGKYKLANDSRSAGHNGVQDIIEKLGTQKFERFRVGIGKDEKKETSDFVLDRFSPEELGLIEKVLEEIEEKLEKRLAVKQKN